MVPASAITLPSTGTGGAARSSSRPAGSAGRRRLSRFPDRKRIVADRRRPPSPRTFSRFAAWRRRSISVRTGGNIPDLRPSDPSSRRAAGHEWHGARDRRSRQPRPGGQSRGARRERVPLVRPPLAEGPERGGGTVGLAKRHGGSLRGPGPADRIASGRRSRRAIRPPRRRRPSRPRSERRGGRR
jgi:hypothetical protein